MTYRFKVNQEAVWFVAVAAGTVILQALATLDIDKITDWRVWAVGLLAATIRAGAGAALSLLTSPPASPPPAEDTPVVTFTPDQVDQIARRLLELRDERARETLRQMQDAARQPVGTEGRG